ncbi:hypothetical protein Tco_1106672 [Tanacetum coccineum]
MAYSSSSSNANSKLVFGHDGAKESKVSETITSVSKVEISNSKTSNDKVEMPKIETVRMSEPIIEQWESDSEDDEIVVKPKEVYKNSLPCFEKNESVNAFMYVLGLRTSKDTKLDIAGNPLIGVYDSEFAMGILNSDYNGKDRAEGFLIAAGFIRVLGFRITQTIWQLVKKYDFNDAIYYCQLWQISDNEAFGFSAGCLFHFNTTNGNQFTMSYDKELAIPVQTASGLASPKQTALGKDFSNLLMADSLPKTIWLSIHHENLKTTYLIMKKRKFGVRMHPKGEDDDEMQRLPSLLMKLSNDARNKTTRFQSTIRRGKKCLVHPMVIKKLTLKENLID